MAVVGFAGLLGLAAALAPLDPEFRTELQPGGSLPAGELFSPPRTAFVVLASDELTPLYVSLIERYEKALAPFKTVDFIVCLSASNYTHTPAQAQALHSSWTSTLPTADIRLVTTDDIGAAFPALTPIVPLEDQRRPFEWAHHEPTLLSSELKRAPASALRSFTPAAESLHTP